MGGAGERSLLVADEGHEIASTTEVDDAEDPERDEETRTGSVASASSVG